MSSEKLATVLDFLPYEYVKEYQFDKHYNKRLWRSDFCIPEYGILLEYEGLDLGSKFKKSKKSRHQNPVGFTNDCEKYNTAITQGFIVLRYTVLSLNDTSKVINDIENAVNNRQTNFDYKEVCFKCSKEIKIPKSLWLKNDLGIKCLTCQWIEDDIKKQSKSKPKAKKKLS